MEDRRHSFFLIEATRTECKDHDSHCNKARRNLRAAVRAATRLLKIASRAESSSASFLREAAMLRMQSPSSRASSEEVSRQNRREDARKAAALNMEERACVSQSRIVLEPRFQPRKKQ